ncbi:MAG TPA: hypothetical protein ENH40_00450 [Nitrospirae bacterium]|nr:hypothetical protein [Nitrospirota bacterium]
MAFAKERVYSGNVIDADTKEPIEGAVVVAIWLKELTTSTEAIDDVKETLTDGVGRWSLLIPEGKIDKTILDLLPFSGKTISEVAGPHFTVFKPGYCSWPDLSVSICRERMKPVEAGEFIKGDITNITIELPKLTSNKDRRRTLPELIHGGREIYIKERRFIRLINAERRYLGLPEYDDLKEFEE